MRDEKGKDCSVCGVYKEYAEYYINKSKKDGHASQCGVCSIKICKKYRDTHKEAITAHNKEYRSKNVEFLKKKNKVWHVENKDRVREQTKEYRKINRVILNKKAFEKRRENICHMLLCITSKSVDRALKNYTRNQPVLELLGCSYGLLKIHIERQFKPGMTWENHGLKGWHLDHIKPISHFDFSKQEDQYKCFNYTNTQPLWAYKNLSKNNRFVG